MAAQHHSAVEAKEQVLADRLDRLEAAPVENGSELLDRGARVRRLDLQLLADEDLQSLRRTMERISFRHRPESMLAE